MSGIHKCPRCGLEMKNAGRRGVRSASGSETLGETWDCQDAECGETLEIIYRWPRPIPVTERLPERGEDVLAFYRHDDGYAGWYMGEFRDGDWIDHFDEGDGKRNNVVTHWLPTPPAPNGGS